MFKAQGHIVFGTDEMAGRIGAEVAAGFPGNGIADVQRRKPNPGAAAVIVKTGTVGAILINEQTGGRLKDGIALYFGHTGYQESACCTVKVEDGAGIGCGPAVVDGYILGKAGYTQRKCTEKQDELLHQKYS